MDPMYIYNEYFGGHRPGGGGGGGDLISLLPGLKFPHPLALLGPRPMLPFGPGGGLSPPHSLLAR